MCLPWLAQTGVRWARLLADLRAARKAMPIKDSLIAATALVHDLVVVTRNTRDFAQVPACALRTGWIRHFFLRLVEKTRSKRNPKFHRRQSDPLFQNGTVGVVATD